MKKQNKIKKISVALLALTLSALCFVSSVSAEAQGWYCVRNKEHKQPTLDAAQKYIEELGGYYVVNKDVLAALPVYQGEVASV